MPYLVVTPREGSTVLQSFNAISALEDTALGICAPQVLLSGLPDTEGIPKDGRLEEAQRLEIAGYRNLPFGRLYEGHVNALQLIARCGTPEQYYAAESAIKRGELFGLWNTEAADGVTIAQENHEGLILQGRKTFCSGAPDVAHAIITARRKTNLPQMVIFNMHRETPPIDPSFWRPMGMQRSDSFAVDFTQKRVAPQEILGAPNAYAETPWFEAGAWRFLAVQSGGVKRIVHEYLTWLKRSGRAVEQIAEENVGRCIVASMTCGNWIKECAGAWEAFDNDNLEIAELLVLVDAARVAVEHAALEVAERVERGVGARGLLDSAPFGEMICDLRMYLRQPAPDQATLRVAKSALYTRP